MPTTQSLQGSTRRADASDRERPTIAEVRELRARIAQLEAAAATIELPDDSVDLPFEVVYLLVAEVGRKHNLPMRLPAATIYGCTPTTIGSTFSLLRWQDASGNIRLGVIEHVAQTRRLGLMADRDKLDARLRAIDHQLDIFAAIEAKHGPLVEQRELERARLYDEQRELIEQRDLIDVPDELSRRWVFSDDVGELWFSAAGPGVIDCREVQPDAAD